MKQENHKGNKLQRHSNWVNPTTGKASDLFERAFSNNFLVLVVSMITVVVVLVCAMIMISSSLAINSSLPVIRDGYDARDSNSIILDGSENGE